MLYTTPSFVLVFLPATLLGFFLIGRYSQVWAASWLFLASLAFYGYWMPAFTLLLLASIVLNFAIGLRIMRVNPPPRRRACSVSALVDCGVDAEPGPARLLQVRQLFH